MVRARRLVLCVMSMLTFCLSGTSTRAYAFGALYGAHMRLTRNVSPWTGALVYCLASLAAQDLVLDEIKDIAKGFGVGVAGTWAVQWARRKLEQQRKKRDTKDYAHRRGHLPKRAVFAIIKAR